MSAHDQDSRGRGERGERGAPGRDARREGGRGGGREERWTIDVTLPVEPPPYEAPPVARRLLERTAPSFFLDVGSECPLRCVYCCVPRGEGDLEVRRESTERLVQTLRAAGARGLTRVQLLGGEPAMRKDFFELVDAARAAGFQEIILTTKSAHLAKPEWVAKLVEHGVTMVHLSLDAFDREVLAGIVGNRNVADALLAGVEHLLARRELASHLYAVMANANLPLLDAYVRRVAALSERYGAVVPVVLAAMKVHARADRNHEAILPRARATADAVRRAIALGRELGVPVYARHLPACLLGDDRAYGLESYLRDARLDLATGEVLPPERDEWHAQRAECATCACAGACAGPAKRYVEIAGWDEFVPLT